MILDRYIARSIISGTLGAMLVFAALFFFIDFVRQLEHIGTKDFGLFQAIFFVLLNLPQRLYDLAPAMILLGGLISLGAMASSSELIVMRTSGVTIFRIVRSVLQAGLLLAVIVAVAGEFFVPYSVSKAKSLRAAAMDDRVLVGGKHGLWARDGKRYVNVRRVMPNMGLKNISVFELDDQRRLTRSTHAESAYYDGEHWIMLKVKHSEISKLGITTSTSDREEWPAFVKNELFKVLRLKPEDMSAFDLMQYSDYLEENELDAASYKLAFWVKIFLPLTCLVMLLVAMPLVFNATVRSGGTGQRIIVGLMLGIAFFVFNRAVNNLGIVYQLSPVLSAGLPLVLVAGIALVSIRRIH